MRAPEEVAAKERPADGTLAATGRAPEDVAAGERPRTRPADSTIAATVATEG
ncbi:hypothetical protein [Dactylosporangium darangshiense]|uniref:Uncharacterized protein n=1 Tax=Dactylosporangium darangshiense TaxID=579108 RepID=A0ABP8D575_9ACTN